jgi:UDPglucose 6-dehydrogenase
MAMAISVFGLGKVGLTLAACLKRAGNRVFGVDIREEQVAAIRDGRPPSIEPGVADRLHSKPGELLATTDASEAVRETCLSFVIVPTPSNALGGFSLEHVLHVCEQIGSSLRHKQDPHVVAVVSTVMPGSSERHILPTLERASGRRAGEQLYYCYNPSFIALGEVAKGFEEPQYVLIGEFDSHSGNSVEAAHRSMIKQGTPILRMRPVEAEIAKLASNTHETMRVSFANMLLALCAEVPGANVDRITEALTHRMSYRSFRGAVPYGGPCWPRDNEALASLMDILGVSSHLPRAVDKVNKEHGKFVLRKVLELTQTDDMVGLLGMAYKPGTDVTEEAFAVNLAHDLVQQRRRVIAWDPLALAPVQSIFGDQISYAARPEEAIAASNVVVIVNPCHELHQVNWSAAADRVVLDCWRFLTPVEREALTSCVELGVGNTKVEAGHHWGGRDIGSSLDLLMS